MAGCAGVYNRLKNRNTNVLEKLKLAKYVFVSEKIYLPNKEQTVIDIVTGLIVNKKRLRLTEKEVAEVWRSLHQILRCPRTHQVSPSGHGLVIKSSFCQAVFEVLQGTGDVTVVSPSLQWTLGCCQVVLQSPALRHVFTSRYDHLVQLYSHTLASACRLSETNADLLGQTVTLLCHLTPLFRRAVNSNSNQKQVLETTVDKLLFQFCELRQHLSTSGEREKTLVKDVETIFAQAIFDKDHKEIYSTYFMAADQAKSAPPKLLAHLLLPLSCAIKGRAKIQGFRAKSLQSAVLNYVPVFYKGLVSAYSDDKLLQHRILSWLCKHVTGQLADQMTSQPISEMCVGCMGRLFEVVHEFYVYDVAKDNADEKKQLKFYQGMLDILLQEKPSSQLFRCLNTLLKLNHAILEQKIKDIFTICWSVESGSTAETERDGLLVGMVNIYVQLRQLPRWQDRLLTQLQNTSSLPRNITCPQPLLQVFGQHTESLPPGAMLDIWARFNTDISTVYLESFKEDLDLLPNFSLVVEMFSTFMENVRLVDQPLGEAQQSKVKDHLTATRQCLFDLAALIAPKHESFDLVYRVLLLCHSWGELMMLTTAGKNIDNPPSGASSPLDLSLVHPYLSSDQWRRLCQHINRKGDPKCRFILLRLQIQNLRALSLIGDAEGCSLSIESLVDHLVSLPGDMDTTTTWDGNAFSLTTDSLHVAQWKLLMSSLPLLLPFLSKNQLKDLSQHIIAARISTVEIPISQKFSVNNVSQDLLRSPYLHEQSDLLSALLTSLWEEVRKQLSDVKLKSPKKRRLERGQRSVSAVFECLVSGMVDWRQVADSNDRDVESQLARLADSLTELLRCSPDIQCPLSGTLPTYIKVLEDLPVEHLSSGEQVRCLSGLLSLLAVSIIPTTGAPKSHTQELVSLLTHLTAVILDARARCPFMHFVETKTLFSWCELYVRSIDLQTDMSPKLREQCTSIVELIVRGVIRDFSLLSKVQPYIQDASQRLSTVTEIDDTLRPLLSVVTSVLEEISKVLRFSYLKSDVQTLCFEYVCTLADPCLQMVDSLCSAGSSDSLHSVLLRSSAAILNTINRQPCQEDDEYAKKTENLLTRITPKLDTLIEVGIKCISTGKSGPTLTSSLHLVNLVCQLKDKLASYFTKQHKSQLWKQLSELLLSNLEKGIKNSSKSSQNTVQKSIIADGSDLKMSWKKQSEIDRESANLQTETDILGISVTSETRLIVNTMAVLLTSCDADLFEELLKTAVDNCNSGYVVCEQWRIQFSVVLWDQLLTCDLSDDLMRSFCQGVHDTMIECRTILQLMAMRGDQERNTDLTVSVLQLQTRMLEFGQVLMAGSTAVVALYGCNFSLLDHCSGASYQPVFSALYDVLNALLVNHTETVINTIPTFLHACKLLMLSLVQRSDQVKSERSISRSKVTDVASVGVAQLIRCAHCLDRLFSLISTHKVEFCKVAPYLVADYITEVQQVTLIPSIKKALLPAIYSLLSLCDKHGIALLYTVLSPGVTEIFNLLYQDYNKHHRYTGRV